MKKDAITQYDAYAKSILSNKIILGHILVGALEEFKGMTPKEASTYIIGEPKVERVSVESGKTNTEEQIHDGEVIRGLNTEDSVVNEGTVRFDILFYARIPGKAEVIIVNIEAQKEKPKKYSISQRAVFYASRIISSEKGRDFYGSDYAKIKRVYTIWVCMNMQENCMATLKPAFNIIKSPNEWGSTADISNAVFIGVSNDVAEAGEGNDMHRLLGTLFSDKLNGQEKRRILKEEYGIEKDLGEEVNTMCNLGEGIAERAAERATKEANERAERAAERTVLNMYKNGISVDMIAKIVEKDTAYVEAVIAKG